MNREREAAALRRIAEGIYMYADLLFEQPQAAPAVEGARASDPPQTALASQPEMSPFLEEVADEPVKDEGSLTNCPKHHKPYLPSKFKEGAFYCPSDSDDPAWRNSKGKCSITPANAATYLRVKAAA